MADAAPVQTPAWNSQDAIGSAILQYKAQYDQAVQAINNLDQQRAGLVKTTDTLVGAIAALEQLLKNQADEIEAAKAAEAARLAELDKAPAPAAEQPQQG